MTRVRKTAEETVHGMHYETSVEAATLFAHATRVNGDGDESEGGAAGGARSDAGSDDSDDLRTAYHHSSGVAAPPAPS